MINTFEDKNFLRYLNLPSIPNEYLEDVPSIIAGKDELDKFVGFFIDPYQIYPITGKLKEWLLSNIPIINPTILHIHVISGELPIHKDYARHFTMNYIIKTGGENILTPFLDDQHNLLKTYCIEPHRWHDFDGQINHTVVGPTKDNLRIAITIGLMKRLGNEYSLSS